MSRSVVALILSTGCVTACGDGARPAASPPPATAGAAAVHDIRGRITEIAPDRRTVTLDHEAIPGVMAAMTMPYKVDDPSVLEGLKAGDTVHGRMEIRPGEQYYVTKLAR